MHTERLHLRKPRVDDLEAFLAYRNDSANLRLQLIEPMPQADALQFLLAQAKMDRHADNCWIMFAIERLRDSRMIGEVGIYVESATKRAGDVGGRCTATPGARAMRSKRPDSWSTTHLANVSCCA